MKRQIQLKHSLINTLCFHVWTKDLLRSKKLVQVKKSPFGQLNSMLSKSYWLGMYNSPYTQKNKKRKKFKWFLYSESVNSFPQWFHRVYAVGIPCWFSCDCTFHTHWSRVKQILSLFSPNCICSYSLFMLSLFSKRFQLLLEMFLPLFCNSL